MEDFEDFIQTNGSAPAGGGGAAPPSTDTVTNLLESVMDDDEDDMGDFMSPELRMFMEEAAATLKSEQLSLDAFRSKDSVPALDPETPDATTPRMVEDTEDILLKQDVLASLQKRGGDYDDIMKSLAVEQNEERQESHPPATPQKSVTFAVPSPKRVEAPKPQQISRPVVTTPAKKTVSGPRTPSSSSSKKKSSSTGKASKSWSMEGLWKKTMLSPKAPKQPSPAAKVPLPLSPAFQKPAAMTPLPPSPMDSSVKMGPVRGGPMTPLLQDQAKSSPVASFGSKNSSFRPRGRKVAPLPPSPSSRKSPLKVPGLPAYMQPTDSSATRKAMSSPLRHRAEASPQRQRRVEASPQRQRRVEASPGRQRRVDPSPQRELSGKKTSAAPRVVERLVGSSSRTDNGSPSESPPPKILSKTPPSGPNVTNKPRPRVVTASPEKTRQVLPPSAEQPKPAKSAMRSNETKSFYDRLAQPRKQVVIQSPQKERSANESDPTAMTPPALVVPKRMPKQRTPTARKDAPSFEDGTPSADIAAQDQPGTNAVDGREEASSEKDGDRKKPNSVLMTPEKGLSPNEAAGVESASSANGTAEKTPKQPQVVELEGRKKVVVVQSKLAAYIGKSPSSGSSRKKGSLAPSTPGDNVTPRSSQRQSFFDLRQATPRRLLTESPDGADSSVHSTPVRPKKSTQRAVSADGSVTKQPPKPETTKSLPAVERPDASQDAAQWTPDRKGGPPTPETPAPASEVVNCENHQPPSSVLKVAMEKAAVPSTEDSDLMMAMAMDDDEDIGLSPSRTDPKDASTDDNDFLPAPKPARPSQPKRTTAASKHGSVTSRLLLPTSSSTQHKKSVSKQGVRTKQRSGGSSFLKGTAASSTRRETVPARKSTYASVKEAASKARERVLQKRKLEAKKIAQLSKEEGKGTKASAKNPKSGGSHKLVTTEDASAKAKERVRKHQLAAKEAEAKRAATAAEPVVKRGAARSKEEAQAIAKERVRQRQLAALAKKAEMAKRRMERTAYLNSLSYSRVSSTKPPPLASRKVVSKTHWATGGTHSLDPNPITRAFGSPTHGYEKREGTQHAKPAPSKATLTVPKAPRLSTSARLGDKKTPTLSVSRKKSAEPVHITPARSGGLTVPRAPKLSTSAKYGDKVTPTVGHLHGDGSHENHGQKKQSSAEAPIAEQHLTLAEQMNDFMLHGLRDSKPVSSRRERTVTIPKSPKFTKIARRELPKSAAEKEKEMMEYYKSHPFKAAPMPNISQVSHVEVQRTKPQRTLTVPIGPHLQTKERVVYHKAPVGSPNKKQKDDELEMKRQFHARPMPDLSAPSQPAKPRGTTERKPTQPKPFHFASRLKPQKTKEVVAEKEETKKQFKARPLPLTTFTPPAISPARHRSGPKIPSKAQEPTSPKFCTDARAEKRAESAEKHMKHAERVQKKKERKRKQLQRAKHEAVMAEATEKPTRTTPEPFHLTSETRHEQSQQRLAEERARIEDEEEKAHEFKAMPYVPSPKPPAKKYRRPSSQLTKPAPFRLLSDARHKKSEQKRKQQLEEEKRQQEEARRVKANPIPMSTYMYSLPPKSPKKVSEPESPELATSSRAEARREYDEKAGAERLAKQRKEEEMEEQRRKEEEEHLKELRRLPASEGGLMQVARPMISRPIGV